MAQAKTAVPEDTPRLTKDEIAEENAARLRRIPPKDRWLALSTLRYERYHIPNSLPTNADDKIRETRKLKIEGFVRTGDGSKWSWFLQIDVKLSIGEYRSLWDVMHGRSGQKGLADFFGLGLETVEIMVQAFGVVGREVQDDMTLEVMGDKRLRIVGNTSFQVTSVESLRETPMGRDILLTNSSREALQQTAEGREGLERTRKRNRSCWWTILEILSRGVHRRE
ncbi:hypothetical protein LTR37_021471 [Vermiconidia calcicola]|uniref:Uncharacterized protein n=1 Tax=Vermiconidia calcicola TaxID=1690605 RepID=A0ACC3M9M5_9PEZI|nr:hypothetical protein LTR37_021471 [Vermiconidia calcicola]